MAGFSSEYNPENQSFMNRLPKWPAEMTPRNV
jgi:hypothetical protein